MADAYLLIGGQTGSFTGYKSHRLLNENKEVTWSKDHGAIVRSVAVVAGRFGIAGDRVSSITTRIYDESGVEQWTADHGATVYAIAIDSAGNVYTGGARTGSLTTRKYNSSGTLQWSVDHGGTVYAIAVDSSGNVYTGGLPVSNVKIRKYNSSGTLDTGWELQWATGGGYPEQVYALCTDTDHLYATKYRGFSNTNTVRKYRLSDAGIVWSKDLELVMKSVTVDGSGNVYACGERNFGNYHLFKLNSSGTTQWSKDPGGYGALGTGVGVDSTGNVYASASNGLYKYNSSGTAQWNYDHGWNIYGVAVASAALSTSVPGLALPLSLGVPSHTLFDVVPGLPLPMALGLPQSIVPLAPDLADLTGTVAELAAVDPETWGPYVGLSAAALRSLAVPINTGTVAGVDSSMLTFAIIGFQCRRRINDSSWVVASVPYTSALLSALADQLGGELLIQAGFRLPSGPAAQGSFLRMVLTAVQYVEQPINGVITLTGRVINPPYTTTTRTLTGISRLNTDQGRRSVECAVDPLLRPNDTAVAGVESFTVGAIDYRMDSTLSVMTVTEAL